MRILVVIAHYFGRKPPGEPRDPVGSQIEPLSRIAALNASLVALYRNFGKISRTFARDDLSAAPALSDRVLDIVILAKRGNSLLEYIGIDPAHYTVEYIDDAPLRIPYHAQRVVGDRAGAYDCYCVLEDDLIIQDPDFFAKVAWFAGEFGPRRLLAPVRFEVAASGTPAKVVVDSSMSEEYLPPFRRPGQARELVADWRGKKQSFRLPPNPHAAGYVVTDSQLSYWLRQPSFADGDTSWIGPLESAMTLSIGKVFDIYKPVEPDPFFLGIEHYGSRFSALSARPGEIYGDPPILSIARSAVEIVATIPGLTVEAGALDGLLRLWRGHHAIRDDGDATSRARAPDADVGALELGVGMLQRKVGTLERDIETLHRHIAGLERELVAMRQSRSWRLTGPLRWLSERVGRIRKSAARTSAP